MQKTSRVGGYAPEYVAIIALFLQQSLFVGFVQDTQLLYGHLIQSCSAVGAGKPQLDELCVHTFHVDKDNQFTQGGLVSDVSLRLGILVPPHSGSLAEQSHVEDIGFVGNP